MVGAAFGISGCGRPVGRGAKRARWPCRDLGEVASISGVPPFRIRRLGRLYLCFYAIRGCIARYLELRFASLRGLLLYPRKPLRLA